jgi:hypothetical protein
VGSQPSSTENTYLSRIARKKIGIDIPRRDTTRLPWSIAVPWRLAAMKPSGTPRTIEKIIAATASSTVAGKRCFSSSITGRRLVIESPKSNEIEFFRNRQYWTWIG